MASRIMSVEDDSCRHKKPPEVAVFLGFRYMLVHVETFEWCPEGATERFRHKVASGCDLPQLIGM